jgi:hypothetical protein
MKISSSITGFILLFSLSIFGQDRPELSIANIPVELVKDANAVIRHDWGKYDVENSGRAIETRQMEVTRLNQQAGFEELYIVYDMHSKVGKIKIELYDALGQQIRKIKKEEIDDSVLNTGSLYSDTRMKRIDLAHNDYPYTIVYEYEIIHKHIMVYPIESYVSSDKTSVQNWDFTIKVPSEIGFDYRVFNSDLTPNEDNSNGYKTLKFNKKNIPPFKDEPLMPITNNVYPYIAFVPEQFKVEGHVGNMSTWKDYGLFLAELNKKHNNLPQGTIAKIKKMTENATTNAEKVDIIYKYVQDNMRYVSVQLGIGGWQAFDAEYVDKNKYGDCKALSYYTKSLLATVGIESYPVLVEGDVESTKMRHPEDFSYPDFNHMILNVPSENIWLECTQNYYPTNYLGSFTDDRTVLLITENGGELAKTPATPLEKNAVTRKSTIQLDENGAAKIVNSSLYTGPKQELLRELEQNYSQEKWKEWFLYTTDLPSCEIKKLEIQTERNYPKALLTYEVSVRKYGSKGGKRMFVPANCISRFDDVPDALQERHHPVVVSRGYVESDEITLKLPEGYEVESIPNETMNLTSEFGEYTLKVESNAEAGQLVYTRKLKILPIELPAERYNDLRAFYQKVTKADKMKLVLVEKKT